MVMTQAIPYQHGVYQRIGDRLYISTEDFLPVGFGAEYIVKDSKRIEPNHWTNLFGETKDGYSYKVLGWESNIVYET